MSAWFVISLQIWLWIQYSPTKNNVTFCKGRGTKCKESLVRKLMSFLGSSSWTVPFCCSMAMSVYSLVKVWQSGRGSGLNAFHFASLSFSVMVCRSYWFDWWSIDELMTFCNNCGNMKDQNYAMASSDFFSTGIGNKCIS